MYIGANCGVGVVDGTMLALAGLTRLGMFDVINDSYVVSWDEMLPAVAQGAIGIQYRTGDESIFEYVAPLNRDKTKLAVECERAFLARLDGNCRTPIAGQAYFKEGRDRLVLKGMISKPDGTDKIVVEKAADVESLEQARALGTAAGDKVRMLAGDKFAEYQHAVAALSQNGAAASADE